MDGADRISYHIITSPGRSKIERNETSANVTALQSIIYLLRSPYRGIPSTSPQSTSKSPILQLVTYFGCPIEREKKWSSRSTSILSRPHTISSHIPSVPFLPFNVSSGYIPISPHRYQRAARCTTTPSRVNMALPFASAFFISSWESGRGTFAPTDHSKVQTNGSGIRMVG